MTDSPSFCQQCSELRISYLEPERTVARCWVRSFCSRQLGPWKGESGFIFVNWILYTCKNMLLLLLLLLQLLLFPALRVLGSLLSAHRIITDSKQPFGDMTIEDYDNELLYMAHDLAVRLLPAFENTKTGIPYPRVSDRFVSLFCCFWELVLCHVAQADLELVYFLPQTSRCCIAGMSYQIWLPCSFVVHSSLCSWIKTYKRDGPGFKKGAMSLEGIWS